MKKKAKIIIISAILAVALYVGLDFAITQKTIELVGDSTQTVEVFSEYTEQGAVARIKHPLFFGYSKELPVTVSGEVNVNTLGETTVEYSAEKDLHITRTVRVVDTVAPVFSFQEEFITVNSTNKPQSAEDVNISFTAMDNFDGDVSTRVKKVLDGNICTYTVTDSSGNETRRDIEIIILDNEGASLKLKGNSTVFMKINTAYKELGFEVVDNMDEDIASKVVITNNVDMSRNGTYPVIYSVTDSAGNKTSVVRRVVVYGGGSDDDYESVVPNGKVIYLTFDDGPGQYTEQLLDILDKYNVKATFFVTNQFKKYVPLIEEIHKRGHTVAVHTLTHKWDVYDSVDSYLADFNAMNAIIEKYTGAPTRIFRFPGGTNNGVSKSHCKGIMTTLSKQMVENGYTYFDWNVSTNDTHLTDPSDIINSLIGQIKNRNRSMVLGHDIKKGTVEAMEGFIEYALKNGYTFEAIKEDTEPIRFRPTN